MTKHLVSLCAMLVMITAMVSILEAGMVKKETKSDMRFPRPPY